MDAQRLKDLEAKLAAGTITDAETLELLTEGYGHSHQAAQEAVRASSGSYVDDDGAVTYVSRGPERTR